MYKRRPALINRILQDGQHPGEFSKISVITIMDSRIKDLFMVVSFITAQIIATTPNRAAYIIKSSTLTVSGYTIFVQSTSLPYFSEIVLLLIVFF